MSTPVELDRSIGRRIHAGDAAQQRRLSRTVATENGSQLAFADLQRHAVKDVAGAVKGIDVRDASTSL